MSIARLLVSRAVSLAAFPVLAGCAAALPTGPAVMALPGAGKDLPAFQADDLTCRQYAAAQTGYANPNQVATSNAVGSTAVGTVLGAGAGALIGAAAGNPGAGAAIGAGTGLIGGAAVGSNSAMAAGGSVQAAYDIGYTQCMIARGDTVQPAPATYGYSGYGNGYGYPGYGYGYPGYGYGYPGYGYGYPGYVVGPALGLGLGWGWGGYGWGGWHGGWGGWHGGWGGGHGGWGGGHGGGGRGGGRGGH